MLAAVAAPRGGGHGASPQALPPPPHLPQVRRKKSAIFGKFLDFCPLRIAFFPHDAPTIPLAVPEWSMKIKREEQIWSKEMEGKKNGTSTPNNSSWTILLSALGQEKEGSLSNLNCHGGLFEKTLKTLNPRPKQLFTDSNSASYSMIIGRSTGSGFVCYEALIDMIPVKNLWHIIIRNRCMSQGLNQ